MSKMTRKIKAVSPIVATIILIIITIIAGIIIYFYTVGYLAGGSTNVSLKIQGGAIAPGAGKVVFVTLTIKNDGNVPVTLNTLKIIDPAVGISTSITVTPLFGLGSFSGTPPAAGFLGTPTLAAGQSITVQFKYTTTPPAPLTGATLVIQVEGTNAVTEQTVAFIASFSINPS